MKQKVVIIGQGYTGRLSITRSVGMMGYDVILIALVPFKRNKTLYKGQIFDGYSKYVKQVYYCHTKDEKGLIHLLQNQCREEGQKPVIIPDNDFSAAIIDQHLTELKDNFLIPSIRQEQGAIATWMDKTKQKEQASRMGLNVAHYHVIKIREGRYNMQPEITYPCFAKPVVSIIGGKSGLKKCCSELELSLHLDSLCHYNDLDVLVEEYMEIEKEYALLGFSDGKDVVIPGKLELLKVAHGSHYGVAIQGRVSPVGSHKEIVEAFKKYILSIGFVGIFDIDYYKSNNLLYFGELNLRFGGSGYAYTKMGVNLPAMFVKFICGEDYKNMPKTITSTATYLNERMLIDEWRSEYITRNEYKKLRDSSDISFIEDEEDKEPSERLKKWIRIEEIKLFIKKCLGKKTLQLYQNLRQSPGRK